MVDFNDSETISSPATGIVKMLILEARYNLMEAYEGYLKQHYAGVQPQREIVQARLWRLYKELEPSLRRQNKEKELTDLQAMIGSEEHEALDLALTIMNDHCDKIKLTKIDTKVPRDGTDLESMNEGRSL